MVFWRDVQWLRLKSHVQGQYYRANPAHIPRFARLAVAGSHKRLDNGVF